MIPARTALSWLPLLALLACGDKPPAAGDEDGDGHVSVDDGGDDCDDADAAVHPGADDAWYDGVDSDCGGDDDLDADGDGHAWEGAGGDDCDDQDPAVHPGATDDGTDGVDQDCDRVDGPDADGDGFAGTADDCDDGDAAVYPGAVDPFGDGVDQDCDGADGVDADGDGYTSVAAGGLDCDDADPDVNPDATDGDTDGLDQDCDGLDGPDADGDGFADADGGGDDCDDLDPTVHPAAVEVCGDGVDNDCDGSAGACGLEGEFELDEVGIAIRGEDVDGETGDGVASAGDVNGDGIDDLLVGVPGSGFFNTAEGGAAYLILGPISANNDGELDLRFADAVIEAEAPSGRMGEGMVALGDVDGDGYGDIAVGAPGHNMGDFSEMGAAYVFFGPISGETTAAQADATLRITPEEVTLALGANLAAGDPDGDGVRELLVGHGGYSLNEAYLLEVPTEGTSRVDLVADATLDGGSNSDAGEGVAMGDLDGDGIDDIVVGAPYSSTSATAAVYVLLGLPTGRVELADAALKWDGVGSWDQAGLSVAVAPDTNGDGVDDLVIGAPEATTGDEDTGHAYIVHGSATLAGGQLSAADGKWRGEQLYDMAGLSVAGLEDIDGDGLGEVLVGACQGSWNACTRDVTGPGMAYLLSGGEIEGTHTLDEARATFLGTEGRSAAGAAVAPAGDMNADGIPDFLIGAPDQDGPSGDDEGAAWLILTPEGL